MEFRKFSQGYVVRLDPGEEIVQSLTRLVQAEDIRLGTVSALGAANDITIGIFDTVEKKYYSRRYQGDHEISALVGNITRKDGEPLFPSAHHHRQPGHRSGPRRAPHRLHHQRHLGAVFAGVGRPGGPQVQRQRGFKPAGILIKR